MGIWEAVHQLYANTLKKDLRMGRLWCAQWDPGAIFLTQRDDCVFMATCVRSVILPDPSVLAISQKYTFKACSQLGPYSKFWKLWS